MRKAPVLAVTLAAALVAALLAGGAEARTKKAAADWRTLVTGADRTRIRTWRQSFTKALGMARASGSEGAVAAEGVLLRPDAARGDATPPPGRYRCRRVKLGAITPGLGDFASMAPAPCRIQVEDGTLTLVQQDGAQQPTGHLYPDGPMRMIFLGSARMADEARALAYGRDPERNMAGIFERIGADRWRLLLPWPHWESTLQVIEVTPAS